jgi:hypothetical protein
MNPNFFRICGGSTGVAELRAADPIRRGIMISVSVIVGSD